MKRLPLLIILLLIIYINISSQEFLIEKIDEIAYAQEFRSSEAVQIVDNHLFYLNLNGLEIYEISNVDGSISKISIITIADPMSMILYDQNCYISTRGYEVEDYHSRVYRIDVSDILNPEIVDTIEYNNYVGTISLTKMGDNLIVQSSNDWNIIYKTYNLPEMTYLGQAIEEFYYNAINDSILSCQDNNLIYVKQHINHGNYPLVNTIDVSSYSDNGGYYEHFKVISDTILAAANSKNITFWNISNIAEWQYISRYTLPINIYMFGYYQYSIIDNYVILFSDDAIRLLDISSIIDPVLIYTLDYNLYFGWLACQNYDENLYIGTVSEGIKHYKVYNDIIEEITSYYDNIRFYKGFYFNDYIFAGSITYGYQLFDIQNPLIPSNLGHFFDDKIYRLVNKVGGWIVLKDFEDYTLEIYDITEPENPELKNILPLDDYGFELTYCFIDEMDPFSFYLCNHQTNQFWKFDISDPGEPEMLIEYILPYTPKDQEVHNSVAYFTKGSSPYDLLVINGLEENDPYIANDISDFATNEYLDLQEGFLVSFGLDQFEPGQVFQLSDPIYPDLYFVPQFGCRIYIRDNLLFSQYRHIISVYEHNSTNLEPLVIFNGLNYNYNIELIEYASINYLITIEMGNIGLFEYTYVPSSSDEDLLKPELTLSNYPNPFNPETNIVFNLPEEGEVQLDIYNIKGQKVKKLEIINVKLGINEIVWDGKDENNKSVSSGIYMYQLKVDGKTIAGKKCLLLK